MRTRRVISSTPRAPAVARRHVVEALDGAPADVVDAVALMVSELATNCVIHAESDFTVSVEHRDNTVRVDVTDEGYGAVALRDPGPDDPTGRGLRIVAQLADDWGVRQYVDRHGKSVWFTVRVPEAQRTYSRQ